jgi:D-sedoheptulose 7-phosphate isomerase
VKDRIQSSAIEADMTDTLAALTGAMSRAYLDSVESATSAIIAALRSGGKLLIMGNGGSAADAQHIAAELIGRYKLERRALPAVALTTDSSILTAWSNDYSYDTVFSRQIEGLARPGDIVWGISTSGNSRNVVLAFEAARALGVTTLGLLGRDGGKLAPLSDHSIVVELQATDQIQTMHLLTYHAICAQLDHAFAD